MLRERLAIGLVALVVLGVPSLLFGYQTLQRDVPGVQVIDLDARLPADGGFVPDRLRVAAGTPVRLRVRSSDVMHGLVIPGLGIEIDEIAPGKVVTIDFTPSAPGRYAFACTRWCSVDHWRMRGVLEVTGQAAVAEATIVPPLYQQLGIDLDAMHGMSGAVPAGEPSAARGAALAVDLPSRLQDPRQRRALAPAAAFAGLRADPAYAALDDSAVWDLVAWAWLRDTATADLARAESLYARDCAACHGQQGRGDGVMGRDLPGLQAMDRHAERGPADFSEAAHMMSVSDAYLQGKLLRGGMGTGMPEFGSLYTDAELWSMIAYLRAFLFAP